LTTPDILVQIESELFDHDSLDLPKAMKRCAVERRYRSFIFTISDFSCIVTGRPNMQNGHQNNSKRRFFGDIQFLPGMSFKVSIDTNDARDALDTEKTRSKSPVAIRII